nr:hypothetical protein BACY1_08570 [Tenacibaculum mesophilum]
MPKKEQFNSKKALDGLTHIFQNEAPKPLPSEVIKFYGKVEDYIVNIYQKGYSDGVQFKEEIEDNLK